MYLLLNFLMADTTANPGKTPGFSLGGILPFLAIIVVMYLLMILPQQKKQKQHRKMLDELKQGDKVVTAGGIMGTIAGIKEKEKTIYLKVSENTKLEMLRSSIAQVLKS